MIKLDNRLKVIYNMVRNGKKVIDVGSDHGYLIAKLLLDEKCTSGVCTDVNIKCLRKAELLLESYNLKNKIKFYNTDGLKNISCDECDDVVIAGMGSELIIKIVDRCSWLKQINDKHLILQPMLKPWVLRKYLYENGFKIIKEELTCSKNFFYIVISAKYCSIKKEVSDLEKYMGLLLKSPNEYTKNYFIMLAKKFDNIALNIQNNSNDIQKFNYYKKLSEDLNDKIKEI